MKRILAIDPGTTESAFVLVGVGCKPVKFDKIKNDALLEMMKNSILRDSEHVVIERVTSYGMPVGQEVFLTCEWIGRFAQQAENAGLTVHYVYRQEEKLAICHDSRANDAAIRRALIDRFAAHDRRRGTGTKKNPDWFYGFRADIWQAYAVGVTWICRQAEREPKTSAAGQEG